MLGLKLEIVFVVSAHFVLMPFAISGADPAVKTGLAPPDEKLVMFAVSHRAGQIGQQILREVNVGTDAGTRRCPVQQAVNRSRPEPRWA